MKFETKKGTFLDGRGTAPSPITTEHHDDSSQESLVEENNNIEKDRSDSFIKFTSKLEIIYQTLSLVGVVIVWFGYAWFRGCC